MKMYLLLFKKSGWGFLLNLLVITILSTANLNAQINENFSHSCSDQFNSFFLNCIPDWICTSGNPDTRTVYGAVAHGYVNYGACPGENDLQDMGEGIAVNFEFESGKRYKLTYDYRQWGTVVQKEWVMTNNVSILGSYIANQNTCDDDIWLVQPLHPNDVPVHTPAVNTNSWAHNEVVFTVNGDFNFLRFFASNYNAAQPSVSQTGDWFIDNVNIEYLCDAPVPSFELVDAQGNPQTTFCAGEDIFIDASASVNETSFSCSITKRAIGGGPSLDFSHLIGDLPNGWQSGQAGLLHLNDIWDNYSDAPGLFEPGYEYEIQFALSSPCSSWEAIYQTFQVECCEQTAQFDPNDSGCGIDVVAGTNYGSGTSHSWFLLSSTNSNGGPYTLEHGSSSTEFEYMNLQPGLFYTLVHRVSTICDDYCYAAYYRRGANCAVLQVPVPGVIDCDLVNSICPAPGNTIGQCKPVFPGPIEVLSWDASANATDYKVEINFNDDACCKSKFAESTYTYDVLGSTQLNLSTTLLPPWECLSWRVRAVCNSEVLAWTEWNCFSGCPEFTPSLDVRSDDDAGRMVSEVATIAPNPATAQVSVQFDTPFTGIISLTNAMGRKVDEKVVDGTTQTIFEIERLPAGVYQISTQNATQRKVYQLVKQ